MSEAQNTITVIERFYAAFNSGDLGGLFVCLARDILSICQGSKGCTPCSGNFAYDTSEVAEVLS